MKTFKVNILLIIVNILLVVSSIYHVNLLFAAQPKAGEKLPALTLPAPHYEAGKRSLGIDQNSPKFTISDFKSELIIIEVIGVYCPQCFKQAPSFNNLYGRLNKGKMKGRVAMFAIAAGGTEPEIDQLIKSGQYNFPVISDMKYEAHKTLGEPKTPFTIICRSDGVIVETHLGVIEDIDKFYGEIKSLLSKP